MGINRFDTPAQGAYQSPWQPDNMQAMMTLGLGKQQQYDIQDATRQQYLMESLKSPSAYPVSSAWYQSLSLL